MKEKIKTEQDQVFKNFPVPKALRVMIVVLIYNMADTFYVGQTNNPYMVAGTSLILPVFNITLCLAGLAGIGGGALISRLLGQNRKDEARRVSVFSLYLGILIAAVFSVVMGVFMKPILGLLGAGTNTYEYARQYAFCVIVFGGIPTVLSNVLSNLIRSIGRSREAGAGIILGGLLNIALDPLFMFVLLPDGYEVLGAGLATALSNCIACVFFLVVLIRMGGGSVITFSLKAGMAEKASIAAVFAVGIPSAVATFLFDLDYVVIDKLMVSYHDLALAAIGIVLKVERFPLNVGIGICQGMLPLVAYNYGAGNRKRMDDTIRLARGLGLVIAAVSILLYEIFAGQFVRLFISDAQTIEMASAFLRIRVLATPLMFLSFFTVYLFQAFGKGRISLFLGVTRWLVFNIPMLFILNSIFGMYGIVWSQVTADTLTVLLSFYVYRRFRPGQEEMDRKRRRQMKGKGLNRDVIKYIAMFTMLLNHIANIFLTPGTPLFTLLVDIGYFTAPVMCYFLVEGYHYTHSKKRYAGRLAIFALLSEIPFCLAFSEAYTGERIISFCGFNMIFTLLLCFGILYVRENVRDGILAGVLIAVLFLISLFSDWALAAPLFTLLFASAGGDKRKVWNAFLIGAAVFAFLSFSPGVSAAQTMQSLIDAVLSAAGILAAGITVVCFYNEKRMERGRTFSKWFFYLFYPVHLLILGIIRIFFV